MLILQLPANTNEEELVPFGDSWFFALPDSGTCVADPGEVVKACDEDDVRATVEAFCNRIRTGEGNNFDDHIIL